MNVLFFLTPKSEVAHLQKEWTLRQAIEKLERSGYTAHSYDRPGRTLCGNSYRRGYFMDAEKAL